jgi:hypothetical protein
VALTDPANAILAPATVVVVQIRRFVFRGPRPATPRAASQEINPRLDFAVDFFLPYRTLKL